jgi:hypothetical protein
MQLAADTPTPPAPAAPTADAPPTGPVLAQFNYVIRGPRQMPRMGLIDAQAWPGAAVPVAGGFDDAVRAARALAATPARDGIHALPLQQAHGVLQAADGQLSIVALGGFHRERTGPLFVDGKFFEATTLTLQVTRSVPELVAIVGAERVLDLRRTGSAFVVSTLIDRPTSTSPAG